MKKSKSYSKPWTRAAERAIKESLKRSGVKYVKQRRPYDLFALSGSTPRRKNEPK